MADLFISYSRKDIAFAKLLHESLKEHDLESWIDWQDIPPSTEWLKEVYTAIEQANTIIFILSASSALSEICTLEIEHAKENNKRIIPIVINDVEPSKIHPALTAINWIFSRSKDELQPAIASLIKAIQIDYDWVKAHTRLQLRALEWERASQDKSFLLQGTDLQQAEYWLAEAPKKEPEPTLMQTRYIHSSRQESVKRQRRLLSAVGVALIVTTVLGILALINGQNASQNARSLATQVVIAEENARLAHIRELTAISQLSGNRFDIAMLLGVESFNVIENYQTTSNLFRLTQLNTKVSRIIRHEGVRRISFSPDGKYLASAGNEESIILWDAASGQPAGITFPLEYGFDAMSFSPDGKYLATASGQQIILWDVTGGQQKYIGFLPDGVTNISFSPDGKILATGGKASIILWNIASGQPIGEPLPGFYNEGEQNISFSPDGKILAYTSGENSLSDIIFWDVATGQPIQEPLQANSGFIHAISFSPDGNILASAGEGENIILWDTASRQPITRIFHGHSAGVLSISFSPDGNTLATASRDRKIILWDVASGQRVGEVLSVHNGEVTNVTFRPDGNTLASCSLDGTIILWDMTSDEFMSEQLKWNDNWGANNAAFSPDRKTLAIGYDDGTTILWDVSSRQTIGYPLRGHEGKVASVAFSSDGKTLASASSDGSIILWDVASMQPRGDPLSVGQTGRELVVSFSPDGAILASGSGDEDGTIILWDTTSGHPLGEPLQRNIRFINCVAFSPDGKILAAGYETAIVLYDVVNRKPIGELRGGHVGWVDSLAFSPDGAILASGSDDATIVLWDVASWHPLGDPLRVHTTTPLNIVFNPDGEFMASASYDGTIILWDTASRQPLGEPLTAGDTERSTSIIVFNQDGKSLISFSQNGSLISWDTDRESWLNRLCERVGRNFTQEEWAFYFPGEAYRKTCEQWPEGN